MTNHLEREGFYDSGSNHRQDGIPGPSPFSPRPDPLIEQQIAQISLTEILPEYSA